MIILQPSQPSSRRPGTVVPPSPLSLSLSLYLSLSSFSFLQSAKASFTALAGAAYARRRCRVPCWLG
jgi:hypothetical protein